jgi:hypothetical protein
MRMEKKAYISPGIESEILELPKAKADDNGYGGYTSCHIMKANTSQWYFENGQNYLDYNPTYTC